MYLHIGNNYIIDTKNIIGIFNINKVERKEDIRTIRTCNEKEKSIILYKKENEIIEYITNISTNTLEKRVNKYS